MEVPDDFLFGALSYFAWSNLEQWQNRNRELFDINNFFRTLRRTEFYFIAPSGLKYTWTGSNHHLSDEQCFSIEIKAVYNDYGAYLRFLLTKQGNHIDDFYENNIISTRSFWKTYIQLSRAKEPHRLEDKCTADIDLILLAISLALDKSNFDVLIELRNRKYPNERLQNNERRGRPQTPVIDNEQEYNYLVGIITNSQQRLMSAKMRVDNTKEIPRRLLLDANIELMKLGFRPIITLKNTNEIQELINLVGQEGGILIETYTEGYTEVRDSNGEISNLEFNFSQYV